jgi:hypothetical protein
MHKFIFVVFFIAALFVILPVQLSAQNANLVITPKKVVYTRKGRSIRDSKRTFTVVYPVISGIDATLKSKIANTISYWRVFEISLRESLSDTWLDDLNFQVNYNKNGILDIMLTQEGSAAYPDGQIHNLVVNLKTGEQVNLADIFKSDSLDKLAEIIDKKLQIEKQEIIAGIDESKNENPEEKTSLKEQVQDLRFTTDKLNEFSLNDKGVTFFYDANFPHVIQALEPEGRYFFGYSELKPFIKNGTILEQFIR